MTIYRPPQAPPTEPGWYYARVRKGDIIPVFVDNDHEYPGLWVQWGPAILPLGVAAWFGPVPTCVEIADDLP